MNFTQKLNMHTTNYYDTLIEVAEDSPAENGEMPAGRGQQKSVAQLQFEMLYEHPYEYTSDDVLFSVYATRKEIPEDELAEARELFFSKGQPCFRASPLTKRYGWGVHSDTAGKIAILPCESKAYQKLQGDDSVKKVKAMRSKRK